MDVRGGFLESGKLAHLFLYPWIRFLGLWLTTIFGRFYSYWWGLKIGKNCVFRGFPIFRRYPGSFVSIGDNCAFVSSSRYNFIGVNHPFLLSTHNSDARLEIGEGCGFSGTSIGCALSIRIGNHVRCGANTIITDTDWHPEDPRLSPDAPVIIEDNVFLGVGVIVLKGVKIGKGSIIGAGSVVTHDIPAGVIAGGIPAKVLKVLNITPHKKKR